MGSLYPSRERKNRKDVGTVTPIARCINFDVNFSKTNWPYAIILATNLKNMCFLSSIDKTPYESMHGENATFVW